MGLYLQIDLEDAEPLASSSGWGDVIDWTERLPSAGYSDLLHLAEHGWAPGANLFDELTRALQAETPRSADLAATLDNLLSLFRRAQGAEVVSVTDGLGPDDGKDEGGWSRTPQAPDFDKAAFAARGRARLKGEPTGA